MNSNSSMAVTSAMVRPAKITDIPAMMKIANSAITAAQWTEDQYLAIFADGSISRLDLVVEQESVLKGFLVARGLSGEWEIENIVVSIGERRRGLATVLLKELIRIVQESAPATIYLEVRESNSTARSFYEKHGFQQNGRRIDYYHEPRETALLYRISLN
jgi:[ribosomal protein S18]-alanine N-acetyltransferase